MAAGLKCGGTLEERAAWLFSVKGLSLDQYPAKLLAKRKQMWLLTLFHGADGLVQTRHAIQDSSMRTTVPDNWPATVG
jgi:hypothetical protein